MGYVLKSFLLVLLIFPIATRFFAFLIADSIFSAVTPHRLSYEMVVAITLLLVSLFTGSYMGRRHAEKSDLPDSFALRYWPLITPIVLILVHRILFDAFYPPNEIIIWYYSYWPWLYVAHLRSVIIMAIMLSLCYVPLIVSFTINIPSEKKLANTRLIWPTGALVIVLLAGLVWPLVWHTKQVRDNTLQTQYSGATAGDEAVAHWYWPWVENDRLAKLDTPASFVISENFPTICGLVSFVPIYSAVVSEVYQVDDKNELRNYIHSSRTDRVYNRLISREIDLIFALRPSDRDLTAARVAGVELHLTPIAREAFVFFVNNRNPVSDLSIEQIQGIYLRNITNWRQVGGNDKEILPFQRHFAYDSRSIMVNEVMRGKNLPMPLIAWGSNMGAAYRRVAMYRDLEESIGYSFRFFAQEMVQYIRGDLTVTVSVGPRMYARYRRAGFRSGPLQVFQVPSPAPDAEPVKLLSVNGVAPTVENIRNGSYPFIQYIYAVTAGTSNPHVPGLIEWLLSPQGQELIERTGYVGVR